jgi:hypothetical protein
MTPHKAIYLVLMLACFILLLAGCSSGASEPPATATAQTVRIQKLATQMAGVSQATDAVVQQQATDVVAQQQVTDATAAALLSRAATWQVVISDTFDNNHNQWTTGLKSGDLSTETLTIENGKYNWIATAKEGFVYWTSPITETVKDFYLAVDAQQISGAVDGEMNLVFHEADESNFYLFEINNLKQYELSQLAKKEWQTCIDWTNSEAIQAFEPNHLEIIGVNGTYYFYINSSPVGSYSESSATEGSSGLAVSLYNKGDTGEFTFDNFELRVP